MLELLRKARFYRVLRMKWVHVVGGEIRSQNLNIRSVLEVENTSESDQPLRSMASGSILIRDSLRTDWDDLVLYYFSWEERKGPYYSKPLIKAKDLPLTLGLTPVRRLAIVRMYFSNMVPQATPKESELKILSSIEKVQWSEGLFGQESSILDPWVILTCMRRRW